MPEQKFSREDIAIVEATRSHSEAIESALGILDRCHSTKIEKLTYLRSRIRNSRNKNDVIAILFNMLLSGEKMGVTEIDSSYARMFK